MNKEAIFILLDVGAQMHEKSVSVNQGASEQTRLEVAIDCIKEYIQQKLFNTTQSHIGLILFGSDQSEDGIMYIQEIEKPDGNLIRNIMELKEHEIPKRQGGDLFDTIDKTIATINEFVGTKKFTKTIFAFTNGSGESDYEGARLKQLARTAENSNIKINITALDFCNSYEPGCEPEELNFEQDPNETDVQNENRSKLLLLKETIPQNLEMYPSSIAIKLYTQFRTKQATTRVSFRGKFQISKDIEIDIELYKKTNELKLPPLKKYSTQAEFQSSVETGTITKDIIQFLQDDPQMEPVEEEQVIKGFCYGKQLVPITKVFEENMQYTAPKGLKLLGFTDQSNVQRHMYMKDVECLISVQRPKDSKTLVTLIQACFQLKKAAIIRYVFREKSAPKLCILIPHIAANYECFYMCEMPTNESIRDFQFNSLKESTEDQQKAVANLIDRMDLCEMKIDGEESDDEPEEKLALKQVYNPTRQYFFQSIMHKAFAQDQENMDEDNIGLPEVNKTITDYLRPEQKIYDAVNEELQDIKDKFGLEEREMKDETDKKIYWKDLVNQADQEQQQQQQEFQQIQEDPELQLDEEEQEQLKDLKKGKFAFDDKEDIENVSELSPIEDFRKMVENKTQDLVEKAIGQLSDIIIKFIENSFQGSMYNKALQCLKELRKVCIKEEEVQNFNIYLKEIKKQFGNIDSPHIKFWQLVVQDGVTLIVNTENSESDITIEQALQFNSENQNVIQQIQPQQQNDQDSNLEDEID